MRETLQAVYLCMSCKNSNQFVNKNEPDTLQAATKEKKNSLYD